MGNQCCGDVQHQSNGAQKFKRQEKKRELGLGSALNTCSTLESSRT